MISAQHRYGNSNRTEIVELMPPGFASVLDVGCGQGQLLKGLRSNFPEASLWGIEADAAAAEAARSHGLNIITGQFPDNLPPEMGQFDVIILADVLEHMVDPWGGLAAAKDRLKPNGRVIASIPNVRHWSVVKQLVVRGRFDYTPTGILDSTHLRFFTKATMGQLFAAAGLNVETVQAHNLDSSWKWRLMEFFGASWEEFRALQYLIAARVPS